MERLFVELARKVKGGGNDALVVGCDCVYRRQRRLLLRRGPDGDRLVTKGVSGAAREVGVRVGGRRVLITVKTENKEEGEALVGKVAASYDLSSRKSSELSMVLSRLSHLLP